ncbi:hypothetical protein CSAL01_00140 [Colletotrichum salicis]|uniref:Uncharacterized protein n=1 Tax=Colletotrichum salicis TaxID=1209931 RepID=A0A135SQR4_9PEZI|nr:hypothetical protein CSAL01_00140 [Colletotrichum salicis]
MCQGESLSWRLTTWSVGFSTQEWDETCGKWAKENRRLPHEDTDKTRQLHCICNAGGSIRMGVEEKPEGVWGGGATSWERETLRPLAQETEDRISKAVLSGRITDDDRDCAECEEFLSSEVSGPHPASSVFGAKLELAWRGTRGKARKVPQIPATPAQVEQVAKDRSGRASSGRFHPNHRLREVLDTVAEHCVAPATPIRLSISRAGVGLLTMLAPLGDGPLCLFHSDGGYEKWGGPCEP